MFLLSVEKSALKTESDGVISALLKPEISPCYGIDAVLFILLIFAFIVDRFMNELKINN